MYTACPRGRIVVIEQAPGSKVQATGVPWDDGRGKVLSLLCLVHSDSAGRGRHSRVPVLC